MSKRTKKVGISGKVSYRIFFQTSLSVILANR
jgi:hypothetical protein